MRNKKALKESLKQVEQGNLYIAQKELGQQNENL
jgi:hypothetical protein